MVNKIKKFIAMGSIGVLVFSSVAFAQTSDAPAADNSATAADNSDAATATTDNTITNDTVAVADVATPTTEEVSAAIDVLAEAPSDINDLFLANNPDVKDAMSILNSALESAPEILAEVLPDKGFDPNDFTTTGFVDSSTGLSLSQDDIDNAVSIVADTASQDVTGELTSQNDTSDQAPIDMTAPATTDNGDSGASAADNSSDNSGPTSFNSENDPYLASVKNALRAKKIVKKYRAKKSVYKSVKKPLSEADYCRDYLLGNVGQSFGRSSRSKVVRPYSFQRSR